MNVIEAQGFSKEKALTTTGLDVEMDRLKNATQAWKKAGSPMSQKQLNQFMSEYIKKNKVVGAYLVIEPASDDTRLRPYNVINEVTDGKRKVKTVYQIKEGEFKTKVEKSTDEEGKEVLKTVVIGVEQLGAVVATADKKDTALKLMKELIETNKRDYVIEIVKEVVEGKKYAGYGQYTPSKSAKQGKFMFFVAESFFIYLF